MLGNRAASGIEKARFCTNFLLLKNCAKQCLDPETEPEPEPKLYQSLNRNHNKSLQFHNTAEECVMSSLPEEICRL